MTPPAPRHDIGATFAARLAERDRAAFAGRRRELAMIDSLAPDDVPLSVLLVHGPEGIGKSALLREIGRRGACVDLLVVWIEGREIGSDPDALEEALAEAWTHERPLVLIDDYDCMGALERHLRSTLLPSLPRRALTAITSRRPPERSWFEGGWEAVSIAMPLGPLPPDESRAVLLNHGLANDPRLAAIVGWAGGWPLALKMAADAARADPSWVPRADPVSGVDAEAVREALRALHVPAALAASPLARGSGMRERAESVRSLIVEAVEHAFGGTSDEQLLKQILVRGYLDPAPSHERAAAELHVSRSTYFRRLRLAADRVATYLSGRAPARGATGGRVPTGS
ncbi:MAG TPA: ATP-binding protein [Solirubrobacteraceae bacterium]|nr:ATP-binding protein [Solirubrobacteraceae bacterium]